MTMRSSRHLHLLRAAALEMMETESHCEPLSGFAVVPALVTCRCRQSWARGWREMRWIVLLTAREVRAVAVQRIRRRREAATHRDISVAVIAGSLRCAFRLRLLSVVLSWTVEDWVKILALICFLRILNSFIIICVLSFFFLFSHSLTIFTNNFFFISIGRQNNKTKISIMEFVYFSFPTFKFLLVLLESKSLYCFTVVQKKVFFNKFYDNDDWKESLSFFRQQHFAAH